MSSPAKKMNKPSREQRLAHIARRRSHDFMLHLISGAVILPIGALLLILFGTVIWESRTAWKRAEIVLPITFPAADEALQEKEVYALTSSGNFSLREVTVVTENRLNSKVIGRDETYDDQIIAYVEAQIGLSEADLTEANAGNLSVGSDYASQITNLFIDPGPYFGEAIRKDLGLTGQTQVFAISFDTLADAYARGFTHLAVGREERISPFQLEVIDRLVEAGSVERVWNTSFLTNAHPTTRKTNAGIAPAIQASLLMMLIVILLAVPMGIGTAIFLEFFAPRRGLFGRITWLIEVNVNNLASVPSITFGLFGLFVFVQLMGPIFIFDTKLATPIVGGMTLSLMTLPTVVVTSRAALLAVPPSFQQAAYGMGATKLQTIFRFVLPYAFPGIMTGVIIGLAQAIGETAPLLVIGMVFLEVSTCTDGLLCLDDQTPALPTIILVFRRLMEGDQLMVSRSYMTIIVLLVIVLSMNALASYIRGRVARSRQG